MTKSELHGQLHFDAACAGSDDANAAYITRVEYSCDESFPAFDEIADGLNRHYVVFRTGNIRKTRVEPILIETRS